MALLFKTIGGKAKYMPEQSYTVEVWLNGEWQILDVFPPNERNKAEELMNSCEYEDARVQQWF